MSFAFTVSIMLLGSSVVIAFVLQPSNEEPATSAIRCHGESLQSIRKSLLRALNLEVEPRLPAGALHAVRVQWQRTFPQRAEGAAAAAAPGSPAGENSLRCCSLASEISMKELGWDNWVIHPSSLTIVQCALCNPETNTVQCTSTHSSVQEAGSQVPVPCCQPGSQEMVPVVYVDESSTVVISSVQLSRSCSCGPGDVQQAHRE